MTKESIEGRVFYSDPDVEDEIQVGRDLGCIQDNYLPSLLEKFIGKMVRVTVEEL
jgi:hypothetical protein